MRFIGIPLKFERYTANTSLLFHPSLQCRKTTARDDEVDNGGYSNDIKK